MPLKGLKILLAEDNPTNQLVAMQMLESLSAKVTLAVDGVEALEIVEREPFDLALIDIEMPRLSGIDLIRHIRGMPAPRCDMPLVALTAYVMREHRSAIDAAGADGIIAKPILSIEQFGDEIWGFVRARGSKVDISTPDTEEREAIDLAIWNNLRASFNDDLFRELTSRIIGDVGSASERIGSALETEDLEEIRAASHILISVAGSIGATHLQSLAQCLNSAGHAADSAAIETHGRALITEAEDVLAFVRTSKGE